MPLTEDILRQKSTFRVCAQKQKGKDDRKKRINTKIKLIDQARRFKRGPSQKYNVLCFQKAIQKELIKQGWGSTNEEKEPKSQRK